MKKWMLASVLAILVAVASPATPQLAAAQAIKLHEQTNSQGKTVQRSYISYAEFQATSVGSAVSGKTTSDKSSEEKVTLGDLAFVSSIDLESEETSIVPGLLHS
jgi:hypothetical protein